jgi:hypothetical protein
MRVYAAVSDIANPPSGLDIEALLERASAMVDIACMFDRYHTDPDGTPSDPVVLQAFHDATVAQAKFWIAAGIDPAGGVLGQADRVSSQSAEGGSVSYASLRTAEAVEAAINDLCEAARNILILAGLMRRVPTIW